MRSFSNILPNFATNLHLLVDSIYIVKQLQNYAFSSEKTSNYQIFLYLCTQILEINKNYGTRRCI